MRRAWLLALLVAAPLLAGCADDASARDALVPYPRLRDVVVYEATGAHVELARWENGHAFTGGEGRVRFQVHESADVLDGARAIHPAFKVVLAVEELNAGYSHHADLYVSPEHQALVQSYYSLSVNQGIVAFDERGFPWLFGASALFGEDLARTPRVEFEVPDNLGRAGAVALAWEVAGTEEVDGVEATRLVLTGNASLEGELWMAPGDPWPLRARLAVLDDGLAPHVRVDGAYPAAMEARRVEAHRGEEPLPGRNRRATWPEDNAVQRAPWDGEKPPDGEPGYVPYPLAEAVAEAKLVDKALADWLAAADDPRVYRATFAEAPGPVEGTHAPHWSIQFVDRADRYYGVEIERLTGGPLPRGVPRVTGSGPAEPPADANHGWFPANSMPRDLVPLSEGLRVVRDVFGAQKTEIILRSFRDPPGYSYYLDGGLEQEGGRYTAIYNPKTAFLESATGPVTTRLAPAPGSAR